MQWQFMLFALNFIFEKSLTQMHQCRMYLDDDFYCSTTINTHFFFYIEEQMKTNNELGEMKGIFYQNPLIILFIFIVAVLVPQMTWQPHSSMPLCLHSVRLSLSSS